MFWEKKFYRQNLGWERQGVWLSSDWLVVRVTGQCSMLSSTWVEEPYFLQKNSKICLGVFLPRGTRTLPHCCASVEGRVCPQGPVGFSNTAEPENISFLDSQSIQLLSSCMPGHASSGWWRPEEYPHSSQSRALQDIEQGERKTLYLCFSLWQVKQKTETRGKDDHMGGREPVENKSSHRKSLPNLLCPRNLFTNSFSF